MRWRLILEEYGPELIYTKGSSNIVADALSRLETEPTNDSIAEAKNFVNIREANAMLCGVEKQIANVTQGVEKRLAKRGLEKCQVFVPYLASTNFPLTFAKILNVQRSDAALLKLLQSNDAYSLKIFRGGGKHCGLMSVMIK